MKQTSVDISMKSTVERHNLATALAETAKRFVSEADQWRLWSFAEAVWEGANDLSISYREALLISKGADWMKMRAGKENACVVQLEGLCTALEPFLDAIEVQIDKDARDGPEEQV